MRRGFVVLVAAVALTASGCLGEGGEGEGEGEGGGDGRCSSTARPANTATECPPGEICRHFSSGESLCTAYGTVCDDHAECCTDCVCLGGTCVETIFTNFHDIDCDTDADCPTGTQCITRNYGNKKCARGH